MNDDDDDESQKGICS